VEKGGDLFLFEACGMDIQNVETSNGVLSILFCSCPLQLYNNMSRLVRNPNHVINVTHPGH
jgi:hypothetical protein